MSPAITLLALHNTLQAQYKHNKTTKITMAEEAVTKRVLDRLGIDHLKTHQKGILDCVLAKKDCLTILPTSYGKSLQYQLYNEIQCEYADCRENIIVCCPLISLMQDQVMRIQKLENITAAFKGKMCIHVLK